MMILIQIMRRISKATKVEYMKYDNKPLEQLLGCKHRSNISAQVHILLSTYLTEFYTIAGMI